jgi:TRAP-type mannitol/chloroaromatic compound transport system substrate-binding protein
MTAMNAANFVALTNPMQDIAVNAASTANATNGTKMVAAEPMQVVTMNAAGSATVTATKRANIAALNKMTQVVVVNAAGTYPAVITTNRTFGTDPARNIPTKLQPPGQR